MLLLLFLLLSAVAQGQLLPSEPCEAFAGGRHTQAHYSCCGVWNNPTREMGYKLDGCSRLDVSYPGNSWQALCIQFNYVKGNWSIPFTYVGNEGDPVPEGAAPFDQTVPTIDAPICNYTVLSVSSHPPYPNNQTDGVRHVFRTGPLVVTKTEEWRVDSKVTAITFWVEYPEDCCSTFENHTIENVAINWSVDPDPDHANFDMFNTINSNAFDNWYAESVGPQSCTTLGLGKCNPDSIVGHADWMHCPDKWAIRNRNGDDFDLTMNFMHTFDNISCGESRKVTFLVVWAPTAREAREYYQLGHDMYCDTYPEGPDFDDDSQVFWPEFCKCNEPQIGNLTSYCTCSDGIENFGEPHKSKRGVPLPEECPFNPSELNSPRCMQERAMWACKTQNKNYLFRLLARMDEILETDKRHFPNVYSTVKKELDKIARAQGLSP